MILEKLLDKFLDIRDMPITSACDHRTPSIHILISLIETKNNPCDFLESLIMLSHRILHIDFLTLLLKVYLQLHQFRLLLLYILPEDVPFLAFPDMLLHIPQQNFVKTNPADFSRLAHLPLVIPESKKKVPHLFGD